MANTLSNMLPLGTEAPQFNLLDTVSGEHISLSDCKGEIGTVIMFICNHCPFVIHVNPEISRMAKEFTDKGISFIGISSNDVIGYPQDRPELMTIKAIEASYSFPYLYDKTQEVAKAYDAACTPDFYLFDKSLSLTYRGQLDDSRPGNNIPLSGHHLRLAINNLLEKKKPIKDQKPSIGCNIKWKKNN